MTRRAALIPACDRLGLARSEAAEYVGVSPTTFDVMVADGRMPRPKTIGARRVWARFEIERAFAELPADLPAGADLRETAAEARRWAAR